MGVSRRRGRLLVVPVLLVLAGCTHDPGTTDGAAPHRSSAAVLAVSVHRRPVLALYRVERDRRATLLQRVQPPVAGERAVSWSLSGGDRPDLCVAWRKGSAGELWCYPFGHPGSEVALGRPGAPTDVALRPDGRALAWTVDSSGAAGAVQDLVTADYAKGATKHLKVLAKGDDRGFWSEEVVHGIAWASDHVLVLERPRDADRPGGYELLDLLRVPAEGWGQNALSVDATAGDAARGYEYLTGVRSATIDWVLALEGGTAPSRAVRAAIGDGRVLQVVGTAPRGQVVDSVSGSADGLVWTTRAGLVERVHLRLKGQPAGGLVTGLPAALDRVVAAP